MGSQEIDLELVRLAQQGDEKAFGVLVEKYQARIIKLVRPYARDYAEAADIAQDTFIKTYKALKNFRGESQFYTWLYRIALNTAKNHGYADSRRPIRYESEVASEKTAAMLLEEVDVSTPEQALLTEEVRRTIVETIESLPEDLRTAILLREIEGLSYTDIARIMDCPVGTVRSRIFRAREAIDKKLKFLSN